MSDDEFEWKKKHTGMVIGAFMGVAALIGFVKGNKVIDSGHFGVKTHWGKVVNDSVPPDWHWKIPFAEHIYEFQNNTIIMDAHVGSGKNTKEQNMLSAETRFHYRIDPKKGVIALHIETMGADNGKKLLKDLMDQSFNAVVAERPSTDHLNNVKALLEAFASNLEWRLAQNNVPASIEAVELLEINIGDGTNPYRLPIQMRIKRIDKQGNAGWEVENMAGPAAFPVEQQGKVIYPTERKPTESLNGSTNDTTFEMH